MTSQPSAQINDFSKDVYDLMLDTTGAEWLAESLARWGKELRSDSRVQLDTKFSNEQSDENLILQFLYWHRQNFDTGQALANEP